MILTGCRRRVTSPDDSMSADWSIEALEGDFSQVFEQNSLAQTQFRNRVRHDDLFRQGMSAKARSQLNCASKKIVVLFDRFAGCGADPNFKRMALAIFLVPGQLVLNAGCAFDRRRCRHERGHNSVSSVLDLATG